MIKIESNRIKDALTNISNRIGARFPDSNLFTLSKDLIKTLEDIEKTKIEISKPNILIRLLFLSIAMIFLFLFLMGMNKLIYTDAQNEINSYIQSTEAALNALALIGAAFYFMFKYEGNVKEKTVLKKINELRVYVHLIDMYQLGKDPLANPDFSTVYSNKVILSDFEMGRYFNYCCELLSITSKVAVIFSDENSSDRISESINDIEILSATLNRKIWQKISLLDKFKKN